MSFSTIRSLSARPRRRLVRGAVGGERRGRADRPPLGAARVEHDDVGPAVLDRVHQVAHAVRGRDGELGPISPNEIDDLLEQMTARPEAGTSNSVFPEEAL